MALSINGGLSYDNLALEATQGLNSYFSSGNIPIDLQEISNNLDISICCNEAIREYEAILLKSNDKKIAIFSKNIDFLKRSRFTLAMIIGHSIIPWHIKSNYFLRKTGSSTMQSEDDSSIEASRFAADLLMPQLLFKKDVENRNIGMNLVKELSDKYQVSVVAFINHLVENYSEKYCVVYSDIEGTITFNLCNRPLSEKINQNSIAFSYLSNPVKQEEIREGKLPAKYWFVDAQENEYIFESSIFNPNYKSIISLIIF